MTVSKITNIKEWILQKKIMNYLKASSNGRDHVN